MARLLVVPPREVVPPFTTRRAEAAVSHERSFSFEAGVAADERVFSLSAAVPFEEAGELAEPAWEAFEEPVSRRQNLAARRNALEAFASQFLQPAAEETAELVLETAFDETDVGVEPYRVLEGLGVLIVDENSVDRAALEASGAQIYEDVLIDLVEPTDENPDANVPENAQSALPWHLAKINIAAARNRDLTGKNVIIGVLDTGVDASHAEIAHTLAGPGAFAEFDKDSNLVSTTPRDAGSHGTHVCGLLAGKTIGVAPGARLAVAAVLTIKRPDGRLGGYLTQISTGLDWLLTTTFGEDGEQVDLINASLGVVPYRDDLYRLAQENRDDGVVIAAAIGNNGAKGIDRHMSPGNYDIVVGVGATDAADAIAPFSDWGTVLQHANRAKPDLCAPGVRVRSCVPGGGYAEKSGTSMATPLVTGTAALLIERDPALRDDADALLGALFALVQPIMPVDKVGRGRLDLTAI